MRYLQSLFHYIDLFIIRYLKRAVEGWQKAHCSKQDQRFCFETLASGEKCICCVELLRSISKCFQKKTITSVLQIMRCRYSDVPDSVTLKIMKSGAELRGNSRSLQLHLRTTQKVCM